MRIALSLASLSLLACQAPAPQSVDGDDNAKADILASTCLFGESWDLWDEGLPDIYVEDGWSVVDASSQLWDGALEQMFESMDYQEGPTSFAGMLAETDNGEFLWREITDQRNGIGYIAWGYLGGDNLHGAIFPMDSADPVARLGDPDIWACTVPREQVSASCEVGENETAVTATPVAETGTPSEVDAVDRILDATFTGSDDVDWYRVDFKPDDLCISCFHPYAFVTSEQPIEEMCVFVSKYEAKERGMDLQCFNGAATETGTMTGCCSSSPDHRLLQLMTDWNHAAGESSSMYLRVSSGSSDTCESYSLVYGHFAG